MMGVELPEAGNGAFQRFHVIFDYAAERLYMK